jgi:UDPglucose--hexose-1-phosphate uridylyltransferase
MQNSHRRKNILTGEWIQVSPHRTKRPWQGKMEEIETASLPAHDATCYLCSGNVRASGEENPNYKQVFVFENDFAALQEDVKKKNINERELLQAKSERGICKVVCFSPKHNLSLSKMTVEEISKVVEVWKDEYVNLSAIDFINHIQIFENKGEIMGCSNPHPHGQIWAQESIPQEVIKESQEQLNYYKLKNSSLLGDYVELELEKNERVIFENNHFVVLVPYWAVWPFETIILPKGNFQNIANFGQKEISDFAEAIQQITSIYDRLFNCPFPYSAGIHQAPCDGKEYPEWRLHMHFYPPLLRSATVKKFMVGYEMLGNPQRDFTPEYAADLLKGAL